MENKKLTLDELEDLVIDGNEEAIRELSRRYREGDGVEKNSEMSEALLSQLGETEENVDDPAPFDNKQTDKMLWDEQYNGLKGTPIGSLREKAENGNAMALMILAEKYLASVSETEVETGLTMLDRAEQMLLTDLSGDKSSLSREALVHLFNLKGKSLEEIYKDTEDDTLPEKIFDAYSNANELDPTQVEGIARCYREGIGVERNPYKARTYEERFALNGGIEEKYKIGADAYDAGEMMRATEWLQSALLAENGMDHDGLRHCARLLLARIGAVDEKGNKIEEQQELDQLLYLVQTEHDPEAALFLVANTDNKEEQQRYLEFGAIGGPDKYAAICAQKAEQIKKETEERKRLEEERKEQERKLEEEAARIRERERELASQKKRRNKIIAIIVIILSVILIAIAGIAIHKNNVKAEQARQAAIEKQQKVDEVKGEIGSDILGTWYECDPNDNGDIRKLILDVDENATCTYQLGDQSGEFTLSDGAVVINEDLNLSKSTDDRDELILEDKDSNITFYKKKRIARGERFAKQYQEQLIGDWELHYSGGGVIHFYDNGTFSGKDSDSHGTYSFHIGRDYVDVIYRNDKYGDLKWEDHANPNNYDDIIEDMKTGDHTIFPFPDWMVAYSKVK